MRRRSLRLLGVLGLLLFLRVDADADETGDAFAIVALIGGEISVVQYRPETSGHAEQNVAQQVPLSGGHFDGTAARAAVAALHRARPGAATEVVQVDDAGSFGDGDALFASGGTLPALLKAVPPAGLTPQKQYLVVISRHRGEAHLQLQRGTIGSGYLSGLGFYVDPYKRMTKTVTGETGRGFIAPYAYLRVDLVDRSSGAVVRSEVIAETATRANAGANTDLNPWDALSSDQKVELLDRLIARALAKTVPQLVAPPA